MNSTRTIAPNDGPALDQSIFDGLLELVDEDDDSFVVELFHSYASSYQDCVDGIARAIADADPDALRRHAHTLKGASANVGAAHLATQAEALQRMGEAGQVEGADIWVEAITEEYVRVIAAVQEQLPGFSPTAAGV